MNNEQKIVCTVTHPEYHNFSLDSELINGKETFINILDYYVNNIGMKPGIVEILRHQFEFFIDCFGFPNKEKKEYIRSCCEDFDCREDSLTDDQKNKIEELFSKESIFMSNEKYHCNLNVYYNGKVYVIRCA